MRWYRKILFEQTQTHDWPSDWLRSIKREKSALLLLTFSHKAVHLSTKTMTMNVLRLVLNTNKKEYMLKYKRSERTGLTAIPMLMRSQHQQRTLLCRCRKKNHVVNACHSRCYSFQNFESSLVWYVFDHQYPLEPISIHSKILFQAHHSLFTHLDPIPGLWTGCF